MGTEHSYTTRKQIMWGLVLIALGVIFLLDRMDLVEAETLWHYWPLLMVVAGINQTIGYPSARQFRNGLWTIFTGFWLFAVFENLFGMTFRNSWPLFLLMWGVLMVLTPFFNRRFPQSKEKDHA
jgi:CDP-diglyceride synthetase